MNVKPPRRGVSKAVMVRITGGRGRRGPLAVWLLANAARICVAEADSTLRWDDIARQAATDGVEVRSGEPYSGKAASNVWGRLRRAGWVKSAGIEAQTPVSVPVQQAQGMVPAARGQAGTEGASGVQPPAPVPSTTAASPDPATGSGEAASKTPKLSATDMPRRRRFGDK